MKKHMFFLFFSLCVIHTYSFTMENGEKETVSEERKKETVMHPLDRETLSKDANFIWMMLKTISAIDIIATYQPERLNQLWPQVTLHEKIHDGKDQKEIKFNICEIQNHAIECYKKSRSWFENHLVLSGIAVGATGIGIGWLAKTWWENRK